MSLFRISIQGDLKKFLQMEERAAARAVTTAMRRSSTGLKNEMRRQVKKAGMGERFANTWRSEVYPTRRTSIGAAAIVWSKAKYMSAFDEGEIINAKGGKWLAIPAEIGYIGSRRVRVKDIKTRLYFVPTKKPNVARLVQRGTNGNDTTLFWLVKQVRLKKTLDFKGAAEKWHAKIPDYVLSEWNRASQRSGIE